MAINTQNLSNREPVEYADLLHAEGRSAARSGPEVVLVNHAAVVAAARDPETYSSAVSRFLQLPNGLDGDGHAAFRGLIERYLSADAVGGLADDFAATAARVIDERLPDAEVELDAVTDLGAVFSVRAMIDWLGWPVAMEDRLLGWVLENNAATRSGDLERTAAVAKAYDDIIHEVVGGIGEEDTVTAQLVADDSLGRPLSFNEVVSILRNWTGGDLSSMAYSIGVILHGLAEMPAIQDRLRGGVSEAEMTAIIDEFLRIDDPFVSNRRVTTCPVELEGEEFPAGTRVRLHWTGANRDPGVFADPDAFDPHGNAGNNLVWGVGPHVCPGKTLSMVELHSFVHELLARAEVLPAGEENAAREIHPVGGWSARPVRLRPLV
ncbi:cytochrome P450 [Corynebacterium doosanense]|uniref:Cytochrome P450 n=1 Tax=Corynebacterium doosanense CAU 212 = DSM 45436 TaxID=558173 RepID=A0A097II21_9CORY|nr:cytochrome P450 [Corynebacterium doosanense]AIT61773.1 cytochrome P450 [Corynebacterium doosanense CAU 212 = DSM 45436]